MDTIGPKDPARKIPELTPPLHRFIEGMGLYFENQGIPRIGGRMLGLLMIAHWPLSAEDLASILQISRGSVSTNIRILLASGLVEKALLPRLRTTHFVYSDEAMEHRIDAGVKSTEAFKRLLRAGRGSGPAARPGPASHRRLDGLVGRADRGVQRRDAALAQPPSGARSRARARRKRRRLDMQLYLRLAWRNIWRHRRRTIIIVLAMGLALAMMMMYDGMMEGFNQAIYGNAIRVLGGNIQIHASGYRERIDSNPLLPIPNDLAVVQTALRHPDVISAARRIQTGGLATNREGAFPVSIIGIEPQVEASVNLIAENIAEGRYLQPDDGDMVVIGRALADEMQIGLGDRFTLVGSDVHKENRQRSVTVVGIYDIGVRETEKRTLYVSLAEAQGLYGLPGQSTEIDLNLKRLGQEKAVVTALSAALPGYEVESWDRNYPELQTAVNNKDTVMNIFSIIITLIAGIGILNMLLMAVYERTREIGLLGAMGLKPRQIAWLFILEGAMMGAVGAAGGVLLGVIFNGAFSHVGFDFSSYASVTDYMALISGRVYPTLGLERAVGRGLTVLIVSTLAAWIPAVEASRREPAEALHHV